MSLQNTTVSSVPGKKNEEVSSILCSEYCIKVRVGTRVQRVEEHKQDLGASDVNQRIPSQSCATEERDWCPTCKILCSGPMFTHSPIHTMAHQRDSPTFPTLSLPFSVTPTSHLVMLLGSVSIQQQPVIPVQELPSPLTSVANQLACSLPLDSVTHDYYSLPFQLQIIQFNSEEQWTKALKFLLTNLKWGLAWWPVPKLKDKRDETRQISLPGIRTYSISHVTCSSVIAYLIHFTCDLLFPFFPNLGVTLKQKLTNRAIFLATVISPLVECDGLRTSVGLPCSGVATDAKQGQRSHDERVGPASSHNLRSGA
uniref:Uncharacterized protein n=1 Tax=Timema cristinae TaxID=61476 RepID=A0A7R9CRD1_TIMCR|nr:unnamed protein product [Timema cristinae]